MSKEELKKHYLETTYSVFIDKDKYDINIGNIIPSEINDLINTNESAVILTAWNPRSQAFSLAENKSRNNYLRATLSQYDYIFYDAIGKGVNSLWEAEESFFIIGVDKDSIETVAVEYGQYAYVLLERDKPATLAFTCLWEE